MRSARTAGLRPPPPRLVTRSTTSSPPTKRLRERDAGHPEAERVVAKHEEEQQVKMQGGTQRQWESSGPGSASSAPTQGGRVLNNTKNNEEMERIEPRNSIRRTMRRG